MDKLISVIVPIYNSECYMRKCIESIINQTYKKLEIILVNDGSKDNSLKICEEYAKKDKRIIVLNQPNMGAAVARNNAINICTGDYISFIDSDDWIDINAYEVLANNFVNDYDIIVYSSVDEYEDGKKISKKKMNRQEMDSIKGIILLNSYCGITNGPCDKLYKKNLFEKIKFPEGVICEDYYIMPKIFAEAKKILFDPNVKYHYYIRKNSVSRNNKINMEYINASKAQMNFINEKFPTISYIGNTAFVFANISIYNTYIKKKEKIDDETLKRIHDEMLIYKKDILFNKYLPIKKKIQALLYFYNLKIYNRIIMKIKK